MKTLNALSAVPVVLAACVFITGTGCGVKDFKPSKIFSLDNAWPFDGDEDEPEEGIPVRVVGAWTDTVHTKPGQKPQRGFGGRLMFYGPKDEKPILVDGQLVVYAFDEAGRQPTDTKPTRRYVFPPDQMPIHMSKSDIGASYSFWLPWDDVGGPKAEVSLICRFEPKGGPVITGEQTRHMLPGPVGPETTANAGTGPKLPEGEPYRPAQQTLESLQSQNNAQVAAQHAARQTGYLAPANPQALANSAAVGAPNAVPSAPGRQMTVTAIALPTNFQMPDASAFAQPTTPTAAVAPAAQTMAPMQQQQQMMPPAQFQQPVTGAQPIYQATQPAPNMGAAMMQPIQPNPFQPNVMPIAQRPTLPTVAGPVMYSPQRPGFAMPQVGSQYTTQQAALTQPAQPMVMQASATMPATISPANTVPQQQVAQPMLLTPQQQVAMPMQQAIPQHSLQQLPPAPVRSAVGSPATATIPWR